jgi:ribosomal protein L34E
MTRPMSRATRKAAFMKQAEQMFEELENWYDQYPAASFEEIEIRARQARRKMMGESLGIMINGRDVGKLEEAPKCEKCNQAMEFKDYRPKRVNGLEGETKLERAYYICKVCKKQTFFPPGYKTKIAP